MRCLLKVRFPIDRGNEVLKDPKFGSRIQEILSEIKAEAAYFTAIDGQRGCYVIVNLEDASKIPAIAEPFFYYLNADVEFVPVMIPQDLAKAAPAIEATVKKWGQ